MGSFAAGTAPWPPYHEAVTEARGYSHDADRVRAASGNISAILFEIENTVAEIEDLALHPGVFATIGAPVAVADATLRRAMVEAMRRLLAALTATGQAMHVSVDREAAADRSVADRFAGVGRDLEGQFDITRFGASRDGRGNTPGPAYSDPFAPTGPPPAVSRDELDDMAEWLDGGAPGPAAGGGGPVVEATPPTVSREELDEMAGWLDGGVDRPDLRSPDWRDLE